jgi:hypothetical protein
MISDVFIEKSGAAAALDPVLSSGSNWTLVDMLAPGLTGHIVDDDLIGTVNIHSHHATVAHRRGAVQDPFQPGDIKWRRRIGGRRLREWRRGHAQNIVHRTSQPYRIADPSHVNEPEHRAEVEVVLVHGLKHESVRDDRVNHRIELLGPQRQVTVEEREPSVSQRLEVKVPVDLKRPREWHSLRTLDRQPPCPHSVPPPADG